MCDFSLSASSTFSVSEFLGSEYYHLYIEGSELWGVDAQWTEYHTKIYQLDWLDDSGSHSLKEFYERTGHARENMIYRFVGYPIFVFTITVAQVLKFWCMKLIVLIMIQKSVGNSFFRTQQRLLNSCEY